MTPCKILKTFKGSQDGRFTETFEAGTVRDLSDELIAATINEGWIAPVSTVITVHVQANPADVRQAAAEGCREAIAEIANKAIITDGKPRRGRPAK